MFKLAKLRESFASLHIDGILVTYSSNRRYMTDFAGTQGAAIISGKEAKLIVDSRYFEAATLQAKQYEVIQQKDTLQEHVALEVEKMGITKLGFEQDHLTYSTFKKYIEKINAEMIETSELVENLRMIKTTEEIRRIKTAAEIADFTFARILKFIQPGVTEKEIANEMEFIMRKQGADSSAFDFIIASGYRGALPHGYASDKEIARGEMITLDFGAYYEGYRSDMTRTIAVGEPTDQLKAIYQIVLDAGNSCIQSLAPGVLCKDVDIATHAYIEQLGYGEYFGHGTGHSIGLDIHEEPFFALKSEKVLAPGMIMTVEPGIYIPNVGGVRIEDDVLITETGHEVITHYPKELIIL